MFRHSITRFLRFIQDFLRIYTAWNELLEVLIKILDKDPSKTITCRKHFFAKMYSSRKSTGPVSNGLWDHARIPSVFFSASSSSSLSSEQRALGKISAGRTIVFGKLLVNFFGQNPGSLWICLTEHAALTIVVDTLTGDLSNFSRVHSLHSGCKRWLRRGGG